MHERDEVLIALGALVLLMVTSEPVDWGDPSVIARYLPGGQPVTVKDSLDSQPLQPASPDRRITLAGPVAVQPK